MIGSVSALSDEQLADLLQQAEDAYYALHDEARRRFEQKLRAAYGPELKLVGDIYAGAEDRWRQTNGNLKIAWCFYCGERPGWQRDHKVPRSRGGSNRASNFNRCCQSCNSRKGDMTVEEYRASLQRRTGRPHVFFGERNNV